MHNHRKLLVWQRAHALAVEVYRHSATMRGRRYAALSEQLKRAVASIPANIAEGAGVGTDAQFARHLAIAAGSAREVDNHLAMAVAVGLITEAQYHHWLGEVAIVSRQLVALQRRLRAGPRPSAPVPDPRSHVPLPSSSVPPEPPPRPAG